MGDVNKTAAPIEIVDLLKEADTAPGGGRPPRDEQFYDATASAIAGSLGASAAVDLADDFMRGEITGAAKQWKEDGLTSAHVAIALRAQKLAAEKAATTATSTGIDALTESMQLMVEMQREKLEEKRDGPQLTYDLGARTKKVGLGKLADELLPTTESMAKLERAAKDAAKKGLRYYGASGGEDLASGFRPAWTRTPKVGPSVVGDTMAERVANASAERSAKSAEESIGFVTFATFLGHVLDWGVKMIIMQQAEMIDVLNYIGLVVCVAEEHGGCKNAYWYDFLTRQSLSRDAVRGRDDVAKELGRLDMDRLRCAKMRSEQATRRGGPHEERPAKEARRDRGRDGSKGADRKTWRGKGGGKDNGQRRKQEGGEARRGKNGGQGEKQGEQGGGARARR